MAAAAVVGCVVGVQPAPASADEIVRPDPPSAVTSADYPADSPTDPGHGGVGVPGRFVFHPPAVGADDIGGYAWTTMGGVHAAAANQAPADGPEPVTITFVPSQDGVHTMRVWSRNIEGSYSLDFVEYTFKVRSGTPPAARWSFDELDGPAYDDDGRNRMMLRRGAHRVPGRPGLGSAVAFDGTGAYATTRRPVTAPHPDSGAPLPLTGGDSFTVSAWVRLSGPAATSIRSAVAVDGARSSILSLGYSGAEGRWRFALAASDSDEPAWTAVLSDAAPRAGAWTHVAGTFYAATGAMRLYVNGVPQQSTAVASGGIPVPGALTVGRHRAAGRAAGHFAGAVDDVRVHRYLVSESGWAQLLRPTPPVIALPGGVAVSAGTPATALLAAEADPNVVAYRYSVGSDSLNLTATPATPGGPVTITLPTATPGTVRLHAVAVNDIGISSLTARATLDVQATAGSLTGFVFGDDGALLPGARVSLDPGGYTATAGDDGMYALGGVPVGVYTVTATHQGLRAVVPDVSIDGDAWLDLMLTPAALTGSPA